MDFSFPSDRERAIAAVSRNGRALEDYQQYSDDDCVAGLAVRGWGLALQFASARLCDEFSVVLEAVKNNGNALQFASTRLRSDKGVCWMAVTTTGSSLCFIPQHVRDNYDIALAAARSDGSSVRFLSPHVMRDEEIALAAIRENVEAVDYVQPASRLAFPDGDLVRTVLETNGMALDMLDERFRASPELLAVACKSNVSAAQFGDLDDPVARAIVFETVRAAPSVLCELTEEQRACRELIAEAIAADPSSILLADYAIQSDDVELVIAAVSRDGELLVDLPQSMQHNRDVVLAAARSPLLAYPLPPHGPTYHPLLVEELSIPMAADREVILELVRRNGREFTPVFVHPSLHFDPEILGAAVLSSIREKDDKWVLNVVSHSTAWMCVKFLELLLATPPRVAGRGPDWVRAFFRRGGAAQRAFFGAATSLHTLPMPDNERQHLIALFAILSGNAKQLLSEIAYDSMADSSYDDALAAIARHEPDLADKALEVSAVIHDPTACPDGTFMRAHALQRDAFEADMDMLL